MAENYESLKASLLESGSLFEDEDFPAEQSSIFYAVEEGMPKSWTSAEWKRPSEICDDPQFFVDGTSKFDLDQGDIGNCWFLSAASVLTTKPELFDRVVPPSQSFTEQYAGLFKFNFWRFGEWKEVVIDDRLPTRNGKLMFCKNRDQTNEFWAALMEKAYAKIHGSYQSLESGYSHDALVDFTGGIGEFITIKDYAENSGRLFKMLLRTFKMNSLVCCNIGVKGSEGTTEDKLDTGLVSTHAYSVTNVVKFTNGDATVRLIRCLNPWGYREWKGAWSDGSDDWNSVTDDQKQALNLTTANDGEFWMSFEDFMANFDELQICHLSPESISRALGGKKKEWNLVVHHGQWISGVNAGGCGAPPHQAEYWSNPQYFVKLTDTDETDDVDTCTLIISLMQKFRRQMKTSLKQVENLEEAVGFDILKFKGDIPEELDGQSFDASQLRIERKMTKFEYYRERSGRYDLSPGTYCIIPVTYKPDTEAEFMMRIATEKPVDSGEIDSGSKPVQETSGGGGGGKKRKFDRLFGRLAGDDNVVDARELKKILNKGFKQEDDEGFSKETSRALVNMYGQESKGLLAKNECKLAWQRVRDLQNSFEEFDADDSGLLSRKELKTAFQNTGFGLSKKSVAFIATHFCGKEGGLGFDDFVLVSVKTQTLYERFQRLAEKEGSDTVSGMTFDEWLEATL